MSKGMFIGRILIILSFIPFFSCKGKNDNQQKRHFGNTKDSLITYYENNEKIKQLVLKESKVIKYYRNGNVFSEGLLNSKNQRIGEWKFYTKAGTLSEIREYMIIEKEPYLNQIIYYNEKGDKAFYRTDKFNKYDQKEYESDTISRDESLYAEFEFAKDTINIDEPLRAVCIYYTPVFREKKSKAIVVLGDQENNFNKDFSNYREVKKDTFYSLSMDSINKPYFPEDDENYTIVFGRWFSTSGKKTLKGYLSEYYYDDNESNEKKEIRIFFKKELFVQDKIDSN
ncbi:hypothetical protein [Sinomicrobium sp. M5D2P9]